MRLCLLALLAIPATVHASFDLMLLPDQTSGRIVRFDPINQVQLGSVFTQSSTKVVVASNATAPYAYSVADGGSVKFNYSTGERVISATFPNGQLSASYDGSRIYESINTATVYRYNANLGYQGSFLSGSIVNVMAVSQHTSNRVVVIGLNAAGDLIANNHDTTSFGLVGSPVTLVAAANFLAGSVVQNTEMTVNNRGLITYRANDASHRLMSMSMDAFGGVSGPQSSLVLTGYATATTASTVIMPGHTGYFVAGTNAAGTGTYITEFVVPFGPASGVFTLNGVTMPTTGRWRASNIVAPEPGTIGAMGLGLIALLRRRRMKA